MRYFNNNDLRRKIFKNYQLGNDPNLKCLLTNTIDAIYKMELTATDEYAAQQIGFT